MSQNNNSDYFQNSFNLTNSLQGWTVQKLGALVNVSTGRLDSNAAEVDGRYPYFTCAPLPLKINSYAFDCPAILLAGNNANGIFHLNKYSGKFNAYQRTYVLTLKDDSILDFIFYSLKLYLKRLQSLSQGTATKFLTKRIIETIPIALPKSLEEQQSIAKILSDLDSKIELNQKMNKTLESIAQSIFKHWFIDFEFPDKNGNPYKSSGGEMIYSEELGKEIPEGWSTASITDLATFLNGLPLQKYPASKGEYYLPVIKIRELNQGISESTDLANTDVPPNYVINDGDILFSWSGSLNVVIWGYGKGALNQHLFKVTSDKYPKWLYYQWLIHYLPKYIGIAQDKATTMGHIQRHHLSESVVVFPDAVILGRMNRTLEPIMERIVRIKIERRLLSQIRDSLLPKLMSGKIRVPQET